MFVDWAFFVAATGVTEAFADASFEETLAAFAGDGAVVTTCTQRGDVDEVIYKREKAEVNLHILHADLLKHKLNKCRRCAAYLYNHIATARSGIKHA